MLVSGTLRGSGARERSLLRSVFIFRKSQVLLNKHHVT